MTRLFDIGLPRDVTMDILNKYATYGANTGIGNLGGKRLVDALNEEYRKQVDAPLQEMPKEAFFGGFIEALKNLGTTAAQGIGNVGSSIADAFTSGGPEAVDSVAEGAAKTAEVVSELEQLPAADRELIEIFGEDVVNQEAVNSPVANIEPPKGETVLATEQPGRLEKFQKYLEDNPNVQVVQ